MSVNTIIQGLMSTINAYLMEQPSWQRLHYDFCGMVDFFDPQTMLLNLACAEMMAYYHIPHAGYFWECEWLGSRFDRQ